MSKSGRLQKALSHPAVGLSTILAIVGLLVMTPDNARARLTVLGLSLVAALSLYGLVLLSGRRSRAVLGFKFALALVIVTSLIAGVGVSWSSVPDSAKSESEKKLGLLSTPSWRKADLVEVRGDAAPEGAIRRNQSLEFFSDTTPVTVAYLGMVGRQAELRVAADFLSCEGYREAAQGLLAFIPGSAERDDVAARVWLRVSVQGLDKSAVSVRVERLVGYIGSSSESLCPGSP